jgi:addiction module HigA family antidote
MEMKKLSLVSPGEVLQEKFLEPLGISQARLAKEISVPARRIYEIVQGQRSISPEIALRLAHYFGLSKRFWLDLQARHDLNLKEDAYRRRVGRHCLVVVK